jgi:hypothetical protein
MCMRAFAFVCVGVRGRVYVLTGRFICMFFVEMRGAPSHHANITRVNRHADIIRSSNHARNGRTVRNTTPNSALPRYVRPFKTTRQNMTNDEGLYRNAIQSITTAPTHPFSLGTSRYATNISRRSSGPLMATQETRQRWRVQRVGLMIKEGQRVRRQREWTRRPHHQCRGHSRGCALKALRL